MTSHDCVHCGTPLTVTALSEHDGSPLVVESATDLELLLELVEFRRVRKRLDTDERLVVEQLRHLGISWAKIAFRLDVPRATLQRTYAYLDS